MLLERIQQGGGPPRLMRHVAKFVFIRQRGGEGRKIKKEDRGQERRKVGREEERGEEEKKGKRRAGWGGVLREIPYAALPRKAGAR